MTTPSMTPSPRLKTSMHNKLVQKLHEKSQHLWEDVAEKINY